MRPGGGERAGTGGVLLKNGAVIAVLGEHVGAQEDAVPRADVIQAHSAGSEGDVGGPVYGTLDRVRHDVPAAGQEVAAGDGERPTAVKNIRSSGIDLIGAAVAAFIGKAQAERARLAVEQGNRAAHGAVAEKAGGGAFGDFDPLPLVGVAERPREPADQ